MKRFYLIVAILVHAVGLTEASEKTLSFQGELSQPLWIPTRIDDSYLDDPNDPYHQKTIIENVGTQVIKNCSLNIRSQKNLAIADFKEQIRTKNHQEAAKAVYSNWKEFRHMLHCYHKDQSFDLAKLGAVCQLPSRLLPLHGRSCCELHSHEYDWCLVDQGHLMYMRLDNATPAGYDEIADDPFIAIRTKVTGKYGKMDVKDSWENFSHFEVLSPVSSHEITFPDDTSDISEIQYDLYPGEKIVYHYDQSPHAALEACSVSQNEPLATIEHKISLAHRLNNGVITYQSAYPIFTIKNTSKASLAIVDNGEKIAAGDNFDCLNNPVYEIKLAGDPSEEHISIFSMSARSNLPILTKGANAVDLGTQDYQGSVNVSFLLNSALEQRSPSQPLTIANQEKLFDYISPHFALRAKAKCDKIWWQIARDSDFSFVIPNFEGVQDFTGIVSLDLLTETFFNNGEEYFFRAKALDKGIWSEWSAPYAFKVSKPEPVQEISFDKLGEDSYEISWEGSKNTRYLVFASNARDFVPSIYYDKHINALLNSEIVDFEPNENLVLTTSENKIQIDGRYAYYRIIAEQKGNYSIPSPLIYVYDNGLTHPRNVLQARPSLNDKGETLLGSLRVLFPPAYQYLNMNGIADPLVSQKNERSFPLNGLWNPMAEVTGYLRSPYVTESTWETVTPFLLPENHPIKARLDRIFSNSRVSQSSSTLKKAGFLSPEPRRVSKTVVTKHPKLQGYLLKLFTDEQSNINDWQKLKRRIDGVNSINASIKKHGYEALFTCPQKNLYPLPPKPSPGHGLHRKNFILVAADMNILRREANYAAWKGPEMTKEKLDAIYTVFEEVGLKDSVFAFNVPFTHDGTMAFIDTEIFDRWPISYDRLLRYLSPQMQKYWKELIRNGGPQQPKK